ncbi:PREDICTED: uncharacterized protein LOC109487341 [Branchiostoma belcheri]|uniref:Uncharacterized protein LOC109487341 n=1 Tax=Branchiostoma belcheri TaxID=7741 RepID=A0A6P5AUW3_BRABE|nr:PREDICTED: uncharacterized protein LOC109487341 [Branchiostoma belcheri]
MSAAKVQRRRSGRNVSSVKRKLFVRSKSLTDSLMTGILTAMAQQKLQEEGKEEEKCTFQVQATLPDGLIRVLDGEDGMRVKDLVADAILEYRLTDYRVTMSSTRAILNPDANALMLRGEDILIEDLASQIEAIDPRLAGDARFRVVHELMVTERNYIDALKSIFDIYAEPLR